MLAFCPSKAVPKVTDLSKLFHAISAQDWTAAHELALKMADAEAARGNHSASSQLRGALKPNGHRNGSHGDGVAIRFEGPP